MALTSASTLAEVQAQYDDNVAYDLNGSVSSCKSFIEAGRMLLRRLVDETQGANGARVRQERAVIAEQLAAAQRWWMANDANAGVVSGRSNGVREISFEEFR